MHKFYQTKNILFVISMFINKVFAFRLISTIAYDFSYFIILVITILIFIFKKKLVKKPYLLQFIAIVSSHQRIFT